MSVTKSKMSRKPRTLGRWSFAPYRVEGVTPSRVLRIPGHHRIALYPGAGMIQRGSTWWAWIGRDVYNTSDPRVARALRAAVLKRRPT